MARADLLLDLVEAERSGDRDRFRVLVEAVIAETVLVEAGRIRAILVERAAEDAEKAQSAGGAGGDHGDLLIREPVTTTVRPAPAQAHP